MRERIRIPNKQIPVVPLRNTVLFPGQVVPIVIGRPRSRAAIEKAMGTNRLVALVAQRQDAGDHEPAADELYRVGVVARIENHLFHEGGRSHQVLLMGICRYNLTDVREEGDVLVADGGALEDEMDLEGETRDNLVNSTQTLAKEIFSLLPPNLSQFGTVLESTRDPILLTHIIAQHVDVKMARKQELLEMLSVKERMLALLDLMVHWRDELKLQYEISQKVSGKLGKQQREILLREQIRALQEELDEGKSLGNEDYREKIKQAGMPEDVEKIALDQLSRLEQLPQASPEVHVLRNYVDLLVALPWKTPKAEDIDLEKAEKILNEEHFGLEKIKRRILQHLAVMKLQPEKRGSILLLVGPPGVGKTSLARSIATALSRPYVRISLGGVRDDAEIRGHRRTYVGALPGRIIDGIKRAGQKNPVFVLDEIDKLTRGWAGDPAGALLEVLDPEQNHNFLDHYLDVPFDLGQVFFIATANTVESIPEPLLDRLEVIPVSGYTTNEKVQIARRHLWPKQLSEHGLKSTPVELGDDVLLKIITGYTREAGVRELERCLAAVARSLAEQKVRHPETAELKVELARLDEILESERYVPENIEPILPPGTVTGLAWTPMGGDILFIESSRLTGKGQLTLTGQLGDVMKESAQIAWTLVRSRLGHLAGDSQWDKMDVHLHVPAGAIPKDGPSAGVTMLVALASMVLKRPVDPKLGLTGEITLRGTVTPVGGIKEKLIAAHRAGIRKVILPKRNERDLREIPEEILNQLQLIFVQNIDEVLQASLSIPAPAPDVAGPQIDSIVEFA
jgi:ATP-dependent Lon protease